MYADHLRKIVSTYACITAGMNLINPGSSLNYSTNVCISLEENNFDICLYNCNYEYN
jgi:hypothetical protein